MKKAEMRVMEIIIVATLLFIGGNMMSRPDTTTIYTRHTVQAGDTVWAIAERYADRQVKPFNEFVYNIQSENKLTGRYIQPGDVLIIPMAVVK